jgi:hypothetical protein
MAHKWFIWLIGEPGTRRKLMLSDSAREVRLGLSGSYSIALMFFRKRLDEIDSLPHARKLAKGCKPGKDSPLMMDARSTMFGH